MLLLQFGESWQAFYVSGYISPFLFHGWFLSFLSSSPCSIPVIFNTFFFFFSPPGLITSLLRHQGNHEPRQLLVVNVVWRVSRSPVWENGTCSSLGMALTPSHPSLVSFPWLILVSSLLPCPSNFLPKTGTDLTSLCQNQENPVLAKEFHMVNFLSSQTLTFSIIFCFSSFPYFGAVTPVEPAPTHLP